MAQACKISNYNKTNNYFSEPDSFRCLENSAVHDKEKKGLCLFSYMKNSGKQQLNTSAIICAKPHLEGATTKLNSMLEE